MPNAWEFLILIVVALVVLGPERLPEYAAKLGKLVRDAKAMAETAKSQLKDQMGPEFKDVDWQQYDPRQYDPRRIVREALMDDDSDDSHDAGEQMTKPHSTATRYDADVATPFDIDAT